MGANTPAHNQYWLNSKRDEQLPIETRKRDVLAVVEHLSAPTGNRCQDAGTQITRRVNGKTLS